VDYTITFIELKAEASGYPGWVHSPENEEWYVESFRQIEGIGTREGSKQVQCCQTRSGGTLSQLYVGEIVGEERPNYDQNNNGAQKTVWISVHPWHRGDEPRVCQRWRSLDLVGVWGKKHVPIV